MPATTSRRVPSEDKIAVPDFIVAGEAAFHRRRISRFAVYEGRKSPAARRSVLRGVLHHKLNVGSGTRDEGLSLPEDLVVLLRRDVTIVQGGHNCAVREGKLPLTVGLDRNIVAQNGANTIEVAFLVSR